MDKIGKAYFNMESTDNEYKVFEQGYKSRDKEIKQLREALEDLYKNVFHGEAYCQTNGLPRRVEVMIKAKEALKEIK